MVTTRDDSTGALALTVYNTLIPRDRPTNSRRFGLPQRYHGRRVLVHVDQDRSLGTPTRDGPLITDPTQAILVVELPKIDHHPVVLLVVRIRDLIKHVCSTRVGVYIPWDEWGRSAVVMEDQVSGYGSFIHVYGTHLVVLTWPYRQSRRGCFHVRTFDFSRRGCAGLPLWDEEDGGAGREASFSDGREFVHETIRLGGVTPWSDVESLGDGNFFQVNIPPIPSQRCHRLRSWQGVTERCSQFRFHFKRLGVSLRTLFVSGHLSFYVYWP